MMNIKSISDYISKVFSKWFIYLSILPGLFDTLGFYFRFKISILSWKTSIYIFIATLFVATYLVWLKERKEKLALNEELNELKDKTPKLKLTFVNEKETFSLKNKIIERKLEENQQGIRPINSNVIQRMINLKNGINHSPVIDEFYEVFTKLIFELHNIGNFKASNVRIDIYFPEELIILEKLPQQSDPINISLKHKKEYGLYFQTKNHVRLWCKESLHPDYMEFDEIYISAIKKGDFKIRYEIHSEEIDSRGIKSKLEIEAEPIKEIKIYSLKQEFDRDQREYEELFKFQIKEALE